MPRLRNAIQSLTDPGDRSDTNPDEWLQRRFLIVTAVAMSFGGVVWGTMALVLGLQWQATIPYGYTVITVLNLIQLSRTNSFAVARAVQVLISLLLPFALQWSLGGFVPSGAMMIWALLALTASQSFGETRISVVWLGFFLAFMAISVIVDSRLPVPDVMDNPTLTTAAFAINIATVSITVFALTSYFLYLRQQTQLELTDKNRQITESRQALVESEKMAAIGRLSAGMAHELNNPASAAHRGADSLRAAVNELNRVSFLLGGTQLEDHQRSLISGIEAQAQDRLLEPMQLTTLERMEREDEIHQWLTLHPGTNLDTQIDDLVGIGLTPNELDEISGVFDTDALSLVLRRACIWFTVTSLLGEIGHGSERIIEIVRALKSYTYVDRGEVQMVDLNEGLDNTLIMLGSILVKGITVKRDYDAALAPIAASGGELNQVWTNLIDNAVGAMQGSGDLTIRTRRTTDEVVVQIIDSGDGILPEHLDSVFDPFFTTKAVGDGTGLGLSISHNIVVQKHGGTMTVSSEPGVTCFEVRLPLQSPRTSA